MIKLISVSVTLLMAGAAFGNDIADALVKMDLANASQLIEREVKSPSPSQTDKDEQELSVYRGYLQLFTLIQNLGLISARFNSSPDKNQDFSEVKTAYWKFQEASARFEEYLSSMMFGAVYQGLASTSQIEAKKAMNVYRIAEGRMRRENAELVEAKEQLAKEARQSEENAKLVQKEHSDAALIAKRQKDEEDQKAGAVNSISEQQAYSLIGPPKTREQVVELFGQPLPGSDDQRLFYAIGEPKTVGLTSIEIYYNPPVGGGITFFFSGLGSYDKTLSELKEKYGDPRSYIKNAFGGGVFEWDDMDIMNDLRDFHVFYGLSMLK